MSFRSFLKPYLICFFFACFSGYGQSAQSIRIGELMDQVNNSDSVVVVNFWATYCKPCLAEMPGLFRVWEEFKPRKVSLILVSLDMDEQFPAAVDSCLDTLHSKAVSFWLNETNADIFCPPVDKSWSGAIPATLIYNRQKGYREFFGNPLSEEMFKSELEKAL